MIVVNDKRLHVVTLDFETYYETGKKDAYSLSNKNMNTSEYIRDERFYAHCVSLQVDGGEVEVYRDRDIKKRLKQIDWKNTALLCHNTYFDGFILSHHYKIVPAFYLDTMCMAKGIHGANSRANLDFLCKAHGLAGKTRAQALVNTANKRSLTDEEMDYLMEYCVDDTADTTRLFDKLYPHISDEELQLIDVTIRMFCDPVLRLDTPRVVREHEREVKEKAEVIAYVDEYCTKDDLVSNDKFAVLLAEVGGIDPPQKISLTTGELTWAFAKTDADFIDLVENGSPIVQALCNARLKNKSSMNETRAARLLRAGMNNAKLPVHLNYCGAHTMRWSGGNKLNFQNFPRGGELRKSILAPTDEHVIVTVDSAQIEARVLAWLAGQNDIVDAFANKQDVYKMMASKIYKKHVDDVSSEERFVAKVCVLGLGFGVSAGKLHDILIKGAMGPKIDISMDEVKRVVKLYRTENRYIVDLWSKAEMILIDMMLGRTGSLGPLSWMKNAVRFPNGLFMHYTGITGEVYTDRYGKTRITDAYYLGRNDAKNYIYGGKAVENWVQSLARHIVAEQMLEISKKYRVVMMTHDEVSVVCRRTQADKCLDYMIDVMSTAPAWAEGLPLGAEGDYDIHYCK